MIEGYCINLRGRIEACDLCRRACHAKAISVGFDELTIDSDRCTDCGACVPACPSGAISHSGFDIEELPRIGVEDGRCRIACAASANAAPTTIPCHKMLDARLMAALFAEGAEVIEPVGIRDCGKCPSGDARPALTAATRTLTKWFGDAAPRVLVAGGNGEAGCRSGDSNRAVQRRALLRRAFRSLAPPPPTARPTAPPSFDELAWSDVMDEVASASSRAAADPTATSGEACSGCLNCAELCPTGALEGDLSAGHRMISFDPALCTNCTLCLKICPMEAIAARALRGIEAARAGQTLLYARAEQHCTDCGSHFAPTVGSRGLCRVCENEKEMDEE